jgi:hypothetical protein
MQTLTFSQCICVTLQEDDRASVASSAFGSTNGYKKQRRGGPTAKSETVKGVTVKGVTPFSARLGAPVQSGTKLSNRAKRRLEK